MAESKMMQDVFQRREQVPEDELLKMIWKSLVKLLDAYKTLEEASYRETAAINALVKLIQDYEMNIQQLQRRISEQDAAISHLDMRAKHLEDGTYDGALFKKIQDYRQKKSVAISGSPCIYSDDFYTSRHGYRMCAKIYLNGKGIGRGSHLSLFLAIKKGPFDDILSWPFQGRVTFTLLNQDNKDPLSRTLVLPDQSVSPFQKPTKEMDVLSGYPLFVAHTVIENFEEGFLRDNTIAITVKVDLSEYLPSNPNIP